MTAQSTESSELGRRIVSNIGPTIVVIAILLVFMNYFIQGGLTEVSTIVRVASVMTPIITPIAVISLLSQRVHDVMVRAPKWQFGIALIASFAGTLIIGFGLGTTNVNYTDWYNIWGGSGGVILNSVAVLASAGAFLRVMRARNPVTLWLIFILVLSFLCITPMADTWFPPLAAFGAWINGYVQVYVDASFWTPQYLITAMGILMILLYKEKLSPVAGRR